MGDGRESLNRYVHVIVQWMKHDIVGIKYKVDCFYIAKSNENGAMKKHFFYTYKSNIVHFVV